MHKPLYKVLEEEKWYFT